MIGRSRRRLDERVAEVGVVPERTDDALAAPLLIERDGAVIWTEGGDTPEGVRAALATALGDDVLHIGDAVEVRAAGGRDRPDLDAEGHLLRTPLHSDGFALADGAPDLLALGCVRDVDGGDSFLLDVDAWHRQLTAGPEADRELAEFLVSVPLDRTEPGKIRSIGPIGTTTDTGRRVWVRSIRNEPLPDDPDPGRTRAMVAECDARLRELEAALPRFHVGPAEVLLVDNARIFHGRDPYEDTSRLLWRMWAWSRNAARPETTYRTSDTSQIREAS